MTKIFVGNIPHDANESALQRWVEEHGFGVENVQILRDRVTGHSRGFGFVTLPEGTNVERAIEAMNRQKMNGRALTVNVAHPKTQHAGARG